MTTVDSPSDANAAAAAAALAAAHAALRRGDAPAACLHLQPLFDAGQAFDDPQQACAAAIELGLARALTGEPVAAMRHLVRAQADARQLAQHTLQARAELALAALDQAVGDMAGAVRRLHTLAQQVEPLDDDVLTAEVQHQLGMALARLDRDDEAERCLQLAAARRQNGDAALLGMTLNSLGVLHAAKRAGRNRTEGG